jgi:hypothetical protein
MTLLALSLSEMLTSQFAIGFYTCCVLLFIALYHHLKLKLEHSRYRRMLSDKLELEASTLHKIKTELETVKKENENLRIKVQTQNESADVKNARDLEIYARAEKKMMVGAPGFAGSWEQAKQAAYSEISEEDAGKSTPKRFFQRFFGGGPTTNAEPVKALPNNGSESKERAEAV